MQIGEQEQKRLVIRMQVDTNQGHITIIDDDTGRMFVSTTIYPTTERKDVVDILTKSFKSYITNQLDTEFPNTLRNTWEFNKRLEKS